MEENVYVKLCNHLNKYPLWAPATEELAEILRVMFTPEEAEVALNLTPRLESTKDIAARLNKDEKETHAFLSHMVEKGLLLKTPLAEKEEKFGLLPTAPGLWEVTFAKKVKNEHFEHLARLWREYYKNAWGQAMHDRQKTPMLRVLPIEETLSGQSEVLPYEKAKEFLETAGYSAVIDCACRAASELAGEGCGRPTDVCLMFGDFARFLVETGRGRQIDRDEALAILKRSSEAGLVHLTVNTSDTILSICSCCTCCCTQLRAITYFSKPGAVARSRFVAVVDPDLCVGCGTCEERCQVHAIKVDDNVAVVDVQKCIGCGLCATTCPPAAISLSERDGDYQEPMATMRDLIGTMYTPRKSPGK